MDILILSGVAVYLLFCVIFAVIRKAPRTKLRFFTVLLSAIAAFVFTLILKGNLAATIDGMLLPTLDANYPEYAATLREIMALSPTLTLVLENTACILHERAFMSQLWSLLTQI